MNRNGQPPSGDEPGPWEQPAVRWTQQGNAGPRSDGWDHPASDQTIPPGSEAFPPTPPSYPSQQEHEGFRPAGWGQPPTGRPGDPGPQQPQQTPPPPKKPKTGAVVALIGGILLIIVVAGGVLAWALGWFERSGTSARSTVVEVVTETAAPEPEGQLAPGGEPQEAPSEAAAPEPAARPEYPDLPAGAVAANAAAGSGSSAGDFEKAYTGSQVTSAPFAAEVAAVYRDHYQRTGELNGVIEARSPVTGQTYSMSCRDNGSYVTCTGGNNAVVYIS